MEDHSTFQLHRYQRGSRAKPVDKPDTLYRTGDEIKASKKGKPGLNPYSLAHTSLTTPIPIFRSVRKELADLSAQ